MADELRLPVGERVKVYADDVTIEGDPSELRQRYERELREDGMLYALPEALILYCYEQNHDLPELVVESWAD